MKKLEIKNNNRLKPGLRGTGYKKGFGLLEVLLSATIIIMILAALLMIGRAAINNNESLAERSQAIYLAQEGIEMTRQIRDTNWIDGDSNSKWNTLVYSESAFTIPSSGSNDYYKLEYNASKLRMFLTLLATGTGETITIPAVTPNVTFTRKINVASANNDLLPTLTNNPNLSVYAIKVTSKVTWTFSGQPKSTELSEILTNWRPDF